MLIRDITEKKVFNEKNDFIDNKIEYDQRFFNDGHAEFQMMISDIRKQIKINEEVLALKKSLVTVLKELEEADDKQKQKDLEK